MFKFDAKKEKDNIINWIRDYFRENGPNSKAVVGISGGKDSSIVAALCVEALGRDRVVGVLMPQGTQEDIDVSRELVKYLQIQSYEINIGDTVETIFSEIRKVKELNDVARINTPARIRMAVLYAVSAIIGGRVANTCNLSEDWVGYTTKFGDGAGDFSPIAEFTVTEVKEIGKELSLPDMFVNKVPIDGLCGKTDEENLGFSYEVLDKYIRTGICEDAAIKNKIDLMHAKSRHKFNPIPKYIPAL